MYPASSDFYVNLQYSLNRWVARQPKLFANSFAGTSEKIVRVDNSQGIRYDLKNFNDSYLSKYYNNENFSQNAEKLIKALATVVHNIASETKQQTLTMQVTISLDKKVVSKTLRYENATMYISI